MNTHAEPKKLNVRDVWSDTPGAFKGGVIVGVIAWFFAVTEFSTTTINGALTDCFYLDYAKIGLGALVIVLAVTGYLANRRSQRSLPGWLATAIAAALVIDGALLVLKGLDIVAGVCPV